MNVMFQHLVLCNTDESMMSLLVKCFSHLSDLSPADSQDSHAPYR